MAVKLIFLCILVFFVNCSFGMAYDFIDSIGDDVDVVSDSEVSLLYLEYEVSVIILMLLLIKDFFHFFFT